MAQFGATESRAESRFFPTASLRACFHVGCPAFASSQRFRGHGVLLPAAELQILWGSPCLATGPSEAGSRGRVAGGRSSSGGFHMFVLHAGLSLLLLRGHADCAACLVTGPSGLGQMQGRAADGRSSPAQNSSHSRSGGHSSSERSSGGRIQMCVLHARLSILRFRDRVDRAAGASSATEAG